MTILQQSRRTNEFSSLGLRRPWAFAPARAPVSQRRGHLVGPSRGPFGNAGGSGPSNGHRRQSGLDGKGGSRSSRGKRAFPQIPGSFLRELPEGRRRQERQFPSRFWWVRGPGQRLRPPPGGPGVTPPLPPEPPLKTAGKESAEAFVDGVRRPNDPNVGDRTRCCCKSMGGAAGSSEKLTEPGDSWFSTKTILVVRRNFIME